MVKKSKRKQVDKVMFAKFLQVSKNFEEGAQVADEFEYYNAAGVLIIHAAIALGDALTIKAGGVKCIGENHYEIISLIKDFIPGDEKRTKALNQLEAIISHKNSISYSGDIYTKQDLDKLTKNFTRFSEWANAILNQ